LPDGEKKFQKVFMVELLEGIDAVYEAENKSGYVFVSGQQFIGVKADGTVVTAGVEDTKLYSDAVEKIKSTTLKDVNFSKYEELKNTIVSVKKTASGNFVIEAKGAGYGIKGGDEFHPASNEYIIVRVAVTKDFKIIDCITVSEAETDGVGDACNEESFYGQFVGKTDKNYTEIDAIGGATMTTDGYKQAIERAFNAVKILGGAR
jgi:Na+-translocating ferredoxin:NAD+ oxidoreductase RnfG subunit